MCRFVQRGELGLGGLAGRVELGLHGRERLIFRLDGAREQGLQLGRERLHRGVDLLLAVAGLLLQRTTSDTPATGASTTTVTTAPEGTLTLSSVGTFDPEGDDRENDASTGTVTDGNVATGWSTEVYNSATFTSTKNGTRPMKLQT